MSYGMNSSVVGPTGYRGNDYSGDYELNQVKQFTPEQMKLFKQLFSHVGPKSFTSRLAQGDQSTFGEIETPALKQFSEMQGNIASRFSGMGMGGRRNSGFQNTQNAYAMDFAQQLQSQRQALQRQAIQDLMGMSHDLLGQRPYQTFLNKVPEEDEGFDWLGLGGGILGGLAGIGGGPLGVLSGASIGYGIGSGKGSNTQFQSSPGYGQKGQNLAGFYDTAFRANPALMGF